MLITIKRGKKRIKVAVANKDCPLYTCFTPDKSLPSEDNYYYCSYRGLRGCPDVKIKRNGKMTESKSDEELVQQYCLSCIKCDRSTDDEQEDNYKINMKLQTELLARLAKGRAAEEWKRQAMEVESHWDKQRVAKLLGIGLGENILANIEPKIIELQRQ